MVDKGGDWDRRNRLKVYRGMHLLSIRQFKRSGELLLDALSTFTATELVDYNDFVAFTVISNVLTLSRPDLKKKVRPASLHLRSYRRCAGAGNEELIQNAVGADNRPGSPSHESRDCLNSTHNPIRDIVLRNFSAR